MDELAVDPGVRVVVGKMVDREVPSGIAVLVGTLAVGLVGFLWGVPRCSLALKTAMFAGVPFDKIESTVNLVEPQAVTKRGINRTKI
jgi:hypothetical protein